MDTGPDGPPGWFSAALADEATRFTTIVDDTRIVCRSWEGASGRELVLVHGGAASSRWWDHIAPLLVDLGRVVAIDLSGHGDSAWRTSYTLEVWAAETVGVTARDSRRERVVIGHSLGGMVALRAAALSPELLDRVVVLDSPVMDRTPEAEAELRARTRPHRPSETRALAESRFVPRPAQPETLPYIVSHIASHSVVESGAGWTWKFDPRVFDRPSLAPDVLVRADMPVRIVRAERGKLTEAMADRMQRILGPQATVTQLPDAGHHAMLDRPLELVEAIRTAITN